MKLSEVADQYVTHKQSMGMRFCTEQRTLKSFCRAMGDIAIADVGAVPVLAFIAGMGPVTRFWPWGIAPRSLPPGAAEPSMDSRRGPRERLRRASSASAVRQARRP